MESLYDREVACSASDRQGSNFESCVWKAVSSPSSHDPQEVLLSQFSLHVQKGGLKPNSFYFKEQSSSHVTLQIVATPVMQETEQYSDQQYMDYHPKLVKDQEVNAIDYIHTESLGRQNWFITKHVTTSSPNL